jgi:phage tail-like protein
MIELPALILLGLDAVPATPGPILLNRDPAPGEGNVPRGAPIVFELAVSAGDVLDAWSVRVWIQGALAYDGSTSATVAASYAGPGSGLAPSPSGTRVALVPTAPLPSAAAVDVRVVASSSKGAHRIDQTYRFSVEDITPPSLVAAFALDARTVRVAFDKEIALTPDAAFSLVPQSIPAVRGRPAGAVASKTFLDLTLAAPLSPGVPYEITLSGVADGGGHVLEPPGQATSFSAFRPPRPANRRFDLWSMIPRMNRRADATGDLRAFIACLQEITDWLLADIDALPDHIDIERAPEWMLDRILHDLGNPFRFDLAELQKRRLASILMGIYRLKGTAPGIKNAVRFFVGLDDLTITPLTATTLLLGESALGEDWELGPSTRFARYAFEVVVARVLTDSERSTVTALIRYMKPAHTHFVALREPHAMPVALSWEMGTSELGVASVLG